MLRVALTGGLGSGKSTAAQIFRELGCFVSQSDEIARAMMQPGEPVYDRIVHQFGAGVVLAGGALDRAALARIAFGEDGMEALNGIVHPAVIAAQAEWMRSIGEQNPDAIAMVESALIFETKYGAVPGDAAPWRSRFDRIILVTAPEQVRLQRYVHRYLQHAAVSKQIEGASVEADARARMRAQWPEERKAALSDYVIHNDGSLAKLRAAVIEVWSALQEEVSPGSMA